MNTIREYIEQMFKGVPMTEETEQLKADILANLEDKYLALKEGGASEHEAIGAVIAEFGDIDELLEEFGISRVNERVTDTYLTASDTDLRQFIQAKGKMGFNIGLGVLACLTGVASLLLTLGLQAVIPGALYIGLILLVGFLVIGVGLFIIEGMKGSQHEAFHSPFIILPSDKERFLAEQESYKRSYIFSIVAGVSMCILAIAPILVGALTSALPVLLGVAFSLMLVGVGIILFTYSGNIWGAYEAINKNGKFIETIEEDTAKDARHRKVNYIIDEIYWPIILVIYFVLSFWYGAWAWSWVIFVLGGALESTIKSLAGNWDHS